MRPTVIQWIIERETMKPEVDYTANLLSMLIGCRAQITIGNAVQDQRDVSHRVIYAASGPADLLPHETHIRPDESFWSAVCDGADVTPTGRVLWRETILPTWSRDNPSPDPIAAAFFLVSRIEEWRSRVQDRHSRFSVESAWMVQEDLIERPLVHDYARALAEVLSIHVPLNPSPWPAGKRFCIAFTHDVDRLHMHGSLWRDLRSAAGATRFRGGFAAAARRTSSRVRVRMTGKPDPYDTLNEIASCHERLGFGATFFWINSQPSLRDADYRCDSDEARRKIHSLRDRGFEIGLHGSYNSYQSSSLLSQERAGLSQIIDAPVHSIRQHYLRFDPRTTWQAQCDAGLWVDSTLGFAGRMGFRAGLAIPFQPWDFTSRQPFPIWEVPLVMMDGTAREYMELSPQEAITRGRKIFESIEQVGGAAAVLWHNSSLNEVDWKGWSEVYRSWLFAVTELGGTGCSVSEIAKSALAKQEFPGGPDV